MSGVSRSMCTFEDLGTEDKTTNGHRRLRLTLNSHDQPVWTGEQPRNKPIGRAFALVQPPSEKQALNPEPIKPTEEKVEVIKVYLEGRKQEQARQQQSLRMLSDEVTQIQEVRYCLKTLREQMALRNNGNSKAEHKFPANGYRVHAPSSHPEVSKPSEGQATPDTQDWDDEEDSAKLREVSKRLYARLQEAEKKHQEERERLQAESGQYQQQLSEQGDRLVQAEQRIEAQDRRIHELQRLLSGMECESAALQEKMEASEEELKQLRALRDKGQGPRVEELEKEQAVLKEKIHHLDDMLKSQQRKVRQMIQQLQNSRTVIQERDRVIQDLEEKVAFLEAENRELHDQMDYFLGGQKSSSHLTSERNGQIVYSKPLTPTGQGNKSLPFIKVIEIKS
ncbi:tuftelin-like isoform X1 [Megalops cyprinoides]|uniref:tuftelin-like isoform X1 n=2 Tax=Megalops cyprinoides TaxID=118141 RepID=UPI001864A03D|nr:tuftelin-like isoform X1 [Megalops cyprinoides]